MFRVVDFAAVKRDPRAVFLRIMNQLEGVISRARAAAQNADDEFRIILR